MAGRSFSGIKQSSECFFWGGGDYLMRQRRVIKSAKEFPEVLFVGT